MLTKNSLYYFLVTLFSALLFIPFIGNLHLFDWDEINFAECAREMVLTGDYSKVQLNFTPFWEKPPLFIWMQALCMNAFGINEFAARLPNAICGIITSLIIFNTGLKYFNIKTALFWCLLFWASSLPHLYFKAGLIDPWFNLFIFLSIVQFIKVLNNFISKTVFKNAIFAGLFLGLAVLTKGPAALIIVGLVILFSAGLTKQLNLFKSKNFIVLLSSTIIFSLSWFLVMFFTGHSDVIVEFINYQIRLFETADAGHDGPFYYHVVVLLIGCFPASLFFIKGIKRTQSITPFQVVFKKVMLVLFFVVLVLFSIVKTKIVHYSSLCYFPLTFVAALYLSNLSNKEQYFKGVLKLIFNLISISLVIAIILACNINSLKSWLLNSNLINDVFTQQNLNANGYWNGFEWLIVLPLIVALILIAYNHKLKIKNNLIYSFTLLILFINLTINVLVPKVEQYSQNATIVFYQQLAKHGFDVETHRFKSYACIFYSGRTKNAFNDKEQKQFMDSLLIEYEKDGHSRFSSYSTVYSEWLKIGNIKRPAFIVCKIQDEKEMTELKGFKKLYARNGFVFFVRMPENKPTNHLPT